MIPIPESPSSAGPTWASPRCSTGSAGGARPSPTAGPGSTRDRNYAQTSWQGARLRADRHRRPPARQRRPAARARGADRPSARSTEADLVVLRRGRRAPACCRTTRRSRASLRRDGQARARRGEQGREAQDAGLAEFARARASTQRACRSRPSTARAWATCSTRRSRACRTPRSPEDEDARRCALALVGPAQRRQVVAAQPAARRRARGRLADPGHHARRGGQPARASGGKRYLLRGHRRHPARRGC